jgi:AraC-like DNA-binding protein
MDYITTCHMSYLKKKDGFQGQRAIIIPTSVLTAVCELHPVIKQLYVTDIGYYPNAQYHHRDRPQGSSQHILIYCLSGKGWARVDQQQYTITAGEFILLPADIPHEYKAAEEMPWTIYWIHFKGESSNHYVNMALQKNGHHVIPISFQQNRLHLFEEIYTNLERGYSTDNLCYANMSLQYFLASCCFDNNYNYQAMEKKDNIDLCISYLQEHTDKMLSLSEIAGAINLSPAHIATLFKKKTGFSIIEYFNQLKIQKACQFLLFTDLRVNEIADKLGIEDPYYFSRLFTKLIGVSPVKYRSKRRD